MLVEFANPRYREILKLWEMLDNADIPFEVERFFDGWHINYPNGNNPICSIIEHYWSYGHRHDLLEIQGLLTDEEIEELDDTVLGFLNAEDVFERIKADMERRNHESSII
jgi:hypothetical protein